MAESGRARWLIGRFAALTAGLDLALNYGAELHIIRALA
jgi:hypothetical protein